ncbi:MAG: hypothetical protein Hyperionvirus1_194 [Hyperionvirus sp.]|uniref:Uncharacterized protein n=1 Tax=Hyperionvirus sp. TaxID=2487770 RepID=A0A3G5A5U1_9VIRU|nr:MAG: hypothetical protein Hyperionvirus1_194 [Hyperionvirus sp.]
MSEELKSDALEKGVTLREYFYSIMVGCCDFDTARKHAYLDGYIEWVKDKEIEAMIIHKEQWQKYSSAWFEIWKDRYREMPIFASVVIFIGTLPFEFMVDNNKFTIEELKLINFIRMYYKMKPISWERAPKVSFSALTTLKINQLHAEHAGDLHKFCFKRKVFC